jgi:putative ABC transport system permease protein
MREIISDFMTPQSFAMVLLGRFCRFRPLLASLGTYSVISYSTVQRTPEIGIRMALGAERHKVFQLVIWQGVRLPIIGVTIGGLATLAMARLLSSSRICCMVCAHGIG